jgi:hypothetical protein
VVETASHYRCMDASIGIGVIEQCWHKWRVPDQKMVPPAGIWTMKSKNQCLNQSKPLRSGLLNCPNSTIFKIVSSNINLRERSIHFSKPNFQEWFSCSQVIYLQLKLSSNQENHWLERVGCEGTKKRSPSAKIKRFHFQY